MYSIKYTEPFKVLDGWKSLSVLPFWCMQAYWKIILGPMFLHDIGKNIIFSLNDMHYVNESLNHQ